MKSYKIHLLRHGQTEANEKGLYIGRTDLPLSPAGQARYSSNADSAANAVPANRSAAAIMQKLFINSPEKSKV